MLHTGETLTQAGVILETAPSSQRYCSNRNTRSRFAYLPTPDNPPSCGVCCYMLSACLLLRTGAASPMTAECCVPVSAPPVWGRQYRSQINPQPYNTHSHIFTALLLRLIPCTCMHTGGEGLGEWLYAAWVLVLQISRAQPAIRLKLPDGSPFTLRYSSSSTSSSVQ